MIEHPRFIPYKRESTEERVERGLQMLSQDIRNLFRKKEQQTQSHITRSEKDGAKVVNIINNNIPGVKDIPLQSVKFGFITIGKIMILIIVIGLTIKVLLNPQFLVDAITWTKNFFHSF